MGILRDMLMQQTQKQMADAARQFDTYKSIVFDNRAPEEGGFTEEARQDALSSMLTLSLGKKRAGELMPVFQQMVGMSRGRGQAPPPSRPVPAPMPGSDAATQTPTTTQQQGPATPLSSLYMTPDEREGVLRRRADFENQMKIAQMQAIGPEAIRQKTAEEEAAFNRQLDRSSWLEATQATPQVRQDVGMPIRQRRLQPVSRYGLVDTDTGEIVAQPDPQLMQQESMLPAEFRKYKAAMMAGGMSEEDADLAAGQMIYENWRNINAARLATAGVNTAAAMNAGIPVGGVGVQFPGGARPTAQPSPRTAHGTAPAAPAAPPTSAAQPSAPPAEAPVPEAEEKALSSLPPAQRRQIGIFLSSVYGTTPSGRSKERQFAIDQGKEAYKQATGLSEEQINAAVNYRKALNQTQGFIKNRMEAVNRIRQILQEFGELARVARSKVDDTGIPAIDRGLQNLYAKFGGDPDVKRLQVSMAALNREYAILLSNAALSRGQTLVNPQKEAADLLAPYLSKGQLDAAIQQVAAEADSENIAGVKQMRDLFRELSMPLYQIARGRQFEQQGAEGPSAPGVERTDIPSVISNGLKEGQTRAVKSPDGKIIYLLKRQGKIYEVQGAPATQTR